MTKNEAIETLYACSESGLYLRRGVIGKDVSEEEVARRLREVAAALDPPKPHVDRRVSPERRKRLERLKNR